MGRVCHGLCEAPTGNMVNMAACLSVRVRGGSQIAALNLSQNTSQDYWPDHCDAFVDKRPKPKFGDFIDGAGCFDAINFEIA